MNNNHDIHHVQKSILRALLFTPAARFTDLNTENFSNDQFNFHLKRLISEGIVIKNDDGLYEFTNHGKEFASRYDVDSPEVEYEKQARIGAVVVPIREHNGETHYLIQKRLKQPFFGFYGFVSGKIKYGETVLESAERELLEESGLTGELIFTGTEHKMDYSPDGELLDDKYFYIFRAENMKGELLNEFEGGENEWMTAEQVAELPDLFNDVLQILGMIKTDTVDFVENKFVVEKF